ncbi:hypothetical protein BH09ACT8_BH09ACT8_53800 [soil metagenome]
MRRNLATLSIGDTPLNWQRIDTGYDGGTGWQHSGIAVLPDGDVVVAHPEGHDLVRISGTGETVRIPTELTEMHCLTVTSDAGGEIRVWAADNGHRFAHDSAVYGEIRRAGRVVTLRLDGTIAAELAQPDEFGRWSPTSVALTEPQNPASDIWVADGYGQSLIHRYSADGTRLATLDGSASGTPFDCPHGILIRTGELYVADRSNRRIVILGLDGTYRRTLGEGVLDSPSSMAYFAGQLVVTELFGALAVFDGDRYVAHLGSSGRDHHVPGWPNRIDSSGRTVAPRVVDGIFNSPHGITAHDGALYLTEWMIGGRAVRLSADLSRR